MLAHTRANVCSESFFGDKCAASPITGSHVRGGVLLLDGLQARCKGQLMVVRRNHAVQLGARIGILEQMAVPANVSTRLALLRSHRWVFRVQTVLFRVEKRPRVPGWYS